MAHCVNRGVIGYDFQIRIVFYSLNIVIFLANSVDPDTMPHNVAFYQGLHCLLKYGYGSN